MLRKLFDEEKIEYFSVLDYASCREISRDIMEREPFIPRSVILFLIPYYVSVPQNLSIYAASLDYHIYIREVTGRLISALKEKFPHANFKGYGDHSPIDERDAALKGGLGILGDSGLLINEKYGTFIFIGDIITDVDASMLGGAVDLEVKTCIHCGDCKKACPTGILSACSDSCLSAITQKKGELSEEEVDLMRKFNTVWGCDMCQTACPYNRSPAITPIEFFHKDRIELLTSDKLSSLSKDELRARAFGWRGRTVVQRNLDLLGY